MGLLKIKQLLLLFIVCSIIIIIGFNFNYFLMSYYLKNLFIICSLLILLRIIAILLEHDEEILIIRKPQEVKELNKK